MRALHKETHLVARIGWLRAAVLGANDGIISTASLILGVASAASNGNEAKETVGTIDDLIVTPTEKVPFAVLSVGGFLGMGTKYVVVASARSPRVAVT
jgi:VIT1/CCC1 family predicted Fe2+/Mn2+ transporter